MERLILCAISLFATGTLLAQPGCLWLRFQSDIDGSNIRDVRVILEENLGAIAVEPDSRGGVRICGATGGLPLRISAGGFEDLVTRVPDFVNEPDSAIVFVLRQKSTTTAPVRVTALRRGTESMRLDDVTSSAIYAGKKSERIELSEVTANKAVNNARQVYATIPGLNIWESDGAGLQLGIGGRGLSPNRTSNFTTRQNGYDISADPLGYPESYYTPPLEAVERIELVRGAGSLRYGTQFGGMLNFVMRQGSSDKELAGRASISGGSFGFASLYAELGGTIEGVTYTALYRGARADGWRPNSGFDAHTMYASVRVPLGNMWRMQVDYTFMSYLAQQPGGLTDRQFETDPTQSSRARNWFGVNWNLASVRVDALLSETTTLQSVFFGTASGRQALGNLERINVVDMGRERTLIDGRFMNIGNETTLMHDVALFDTTTTVLAGVRFFHGVTEQRQGNASDGSGPDFTFLRPGNLESSDFQFPNDNAAVFAEAVVRLGRGWSIVPGLRFEHITTRSDGYYKQRVTDFAGNIIVDTNITEQRVRSRSFLLAGLGIAKEVSADVEAYGNISQNYRSITFSDLRIDNPNLKVDSAISDETGFNADVGIRGCLGPVCTFDVSLFYLGYNNRIGQILMADKPPLFLPYRLRANIADAYTAGMEAVAIVHVSDLLHIPDELPELRWLVNGSVLQGEYINTDDPSVRGRQVELVPPFTLRTGILLQWKDLRFSAIASVVAAHYTDATNAEQSATAVNGRVPQYAVVDATMQYALGRYRVELSCNNLFNARYFTRRADAYPGPGIIPADIRSITLTMSAQFGNQ